MTATNSCHKIERRRTPAMSMLVMETSSFQPRVLVISDEHILAQQITSFFSQADFQVEWWGRVEVLAAVQDNLSLEVFDKIVMILIGELKESSQDIVAVVEPYQSKLSVIVPYAAPIAAKEVFLQEVAKQTTYLAHFSEYVQNSLPKAQVFLLQDVWYPEEKSFDLEQWLVRLIEPTQHVILSSLEEELYPQTLDQVWTKLQKL